MPAADRWGRRIRSLLLAAAMTTLAGSLLYWSEPTELSMGWGHFLLGLGLLSLAGSLAGSPMKLHKRALDEETEELALHLAPSLAVSTGFVLVGLLSLAAPDTSHAARGPALLALSLLLLSHGSSGGLFFRYLRRKR